MLHLKRSQNVVKFYSNILNFTSYVCSELLLCLIFLSLIVVIIQKPQSVEELHYLDIRTCRYCHTWFISMLRQKKSQIVIKRFYTVKNRSQLFTIPSFIELSLILIALCFSIVSLLNKYNTVWENKKFTLTEVKNISWNQLYIFTSKI